MIKNAFCLCLKLFSFLYLFFCPDFFGHAGKRLNINANVISKIDDVSYWERNNYTSHIPQWNLVSSEKKSYTKCGGEASPRSFKKKVRIEKLSMSLDQQPEKLRTTKI